MFVAFSPTDSKSWQFYAPFRYKDLITFHDRAGLISGSLASSLSP